MLQSEIGIAAKVPPNPRIFNKNRKNEDYIGRSRIAYGRSAVGEQPGRIR